MGASTQYRGVVVVLSVFRLVLSLLMLLALEYSELLNVPSWLVSSSLNFPDRPACAASDRLTLPSPLVSTELKLGDWEDDEDCVDELEVEGVVVDGDDDVVGSLGIVDCDWANAAADPSNAARAVVLMTKFMMMLLS